MASMYRVYVPTDGGVRRLILVNFFETSGSRYTSTRCGGSTWSHKFGELKAHQARKGSSMTSAQCNPGHLIKRPYAIIYIYVYTHRNAGAGGDEKPSVYIKVEEICPPPPLPPPVALILAWNSIYGFNRSRNARRLRGKTVSRFPHFVSPPCFTLSIFAVIPPPSPTGTVQSKCPI